MLRFTLRSLRKKKIENNLQDIADVHFTGRKYPGYKERRMEIQ